jgi:UDP-3-O-[3-hydroxymyristoyl] glucosamine N-acyltransferase
VTATQQTDSRTDARTGARTISVGQLAAMLGGELVGPPDIIVRNLQPLEDARPGDLSFIRSQRFADRWPESQASAALVSRGVELADPGAGRAVIFVDDADHALITLLQSLSPAAPAPEPGIDPSACVHEDASIAPTAIIGPNCTIEAGAAIADHAHLVANVYVGRGSRIGEGTRVLPGVVVMHDCRIGRGCLINPGVMIGGDGFGFRPKPDGSGLLKIPHVGGVTIGDDVEIGAGTCIDRGKLGDTTIGDGTKIDNLCQIAHNCNIGRSCVICGQTALSGSVTVGDGAVLGGRASAVDNVRIGAGARLAAGSGTMTDIPDGESWLGAPAGPARESAENYAAFRNLAKLQRQVRKILKRDGHAD